MSAITLKNGMLAVNTPFSPGLVAGIKALPYSDRRWDPAARCWLVDPRHGQQVVAMIAGYLGETVSLPKLSIARGQRETRLLEVHYLGQTKDRGDGDRSAFGYIDGSWSVVFPEKVLRDWFEAGEQTPGEASTLYAVLAVSKGASLEDIKTGYRRMAKQWHPDVCKEPGAAEAFMRIQEAYSILSDQVKRSRYDAGLALQASLGKPAINSADWQSNPVQGYRSPLRCGYILCDGTEKMGRFWVERITHWEDIVNGAGQTLIVSWPYGSKTPMEMWA